MAVLSQANEKLIIRMINVNVITRPEGLWKRCRLMTNQQILRYS